MAFFPSLNTMASILPSSLHTLPKHLKELIFSISQTMNIVLPFPYIRFQISFFPHTSPATLSEPFITHSCSVKHSIISDNSAGNLHSSFLMLPSLWSYSVGVGCQQLIDCLTNLITVQYYKGERNMSSKINSLFLQGTAVLFRQVLYQMKTMNRKSKAVQQQARKHNALLQCSAVNARINGTKLRFGYISQSHDS